MGSQSKCNTEEEFLTWAAPFFASGHGIILQEKLDGISIKLIYEDGRLTHAVTRGPGGLVGEDILRNVLKMKGADSAEFDPKTPYPVVDLLPEQEGVEYMGATMRLGLHTTLADKDSRAAKLYGTTKISERHRHRYEVNPEYIDKIEKAG